MTSKTMYYILMAFVCAGVIVLFALITMEMDKRTKASDELMEQARQRMKENSRDTTSSRPKTMDSSLRHVPDSEVKI
jgi:hypothetical protein